MSWLFLTFGRIRFRLVANAPHGLDAAARLPQLLTQGADVDIHCAAGAVELIAPDGVEQLVPGEYGPRMLHQKGEQLEFLQGEGDFPPVGQPP